MAILHLRTIVYPTLNLLMSYITAQASIDNTLGSYGINQAHPFRPKIFAVDGGIGRQFLLGATMPDSAVTFSKTPSGEIDAVTRGDPVVTLHIQARYLTIPHTTEHALYPIDPPFPEQGQIFRWAVVRTDHFDGIGGASQICHTGPTRAEAIEQLRVLHTESLTELLDTQSARGPRQLVLEHARSLVPLKRVVDRVYGPYKNLQHDGTDLFIGHLKASPGRLRSLGIAPLRLIAQAVRLLHCLAQHARERSDPTQTPPRPLLLDTMAKRALAKEREERIQDQQILERN